MMAFFEYQGKQLYYQELGVGHPLLLLHGNTASSNMFYHVAEQYAKYYRVILLDFLGHGQSERLEEFPTDLWFEEAQQAIAFLRWKQYENVYLLGSSGGALVAINVALEAPELVGKVIADSFEGERSWKGQWYRFFTIGLFISVWGGKEHCRYLECNQFIKKYNKVFQHVL